MKPDRLSRLKLAIAMAPFLSALAWADSTVVILRHAEKPEAGLGQLTCRGLNRALALPSVLIARYGIPTAIYATNPSVEKLDSGVAYAYVRPLATIEPLAIRAGLPVNIKWGMTEIESLAAQLLSRKDGTFVVAWEHHWGESLARNLLNGASGRSGEVPSWNDADFDSLFVVRTRYDDQGRAWSSFSHEQQGLDGQPLQCGDAIGQMAVHQ